MKMRIAWFAFAFAAAPVAAFAHAQLEQASPAAGATVQSMPAEVRLKFTKEITEATTVAVTGPKGRAENGKPQYTAYTLRVGLKPMGAGTYTVQWHAISADGHETEGHYSFTVK